MPRSKGKPQHRGGEPTTHVNAFEAWEERTADVCVERSLKRSRKAVSGRREVIERGGCGGEGAVVGTLDASVILSGKEGVSEGAEAPQHAYVVNFSEAALKLDVVRHDTTGDVKVNGGGTFALDNGTTLSLARLIHADRVRFRVSSDTFENADGEQQKLPATTTSTRELVNVTLEVIVDESVLRDSPTFPNERVQSQHHRDMKRLVRWLQPKLNRSLDKVEGEDGTGEEEKGGGMFSGFDPTHLYAAVLPTGNEPPLREAPTGLVPRLRPYQSHAVRWMLDRETAAEAEEGSQHPLWREMSAVASESAGGIRAIYYNPFTGRFSLRRYPDVQLSATSGGILADEMGLGKTVEVLACILSNPCPAAMLENSQVKEDPRPEQTERIDCICGSTDDDDEGLWVLCDDCNTWFHGACVQWPRRKSKEEEQCERAGVDDTWICGKCARFRASETATGVSKATLIICPAAILPQWEAEIRRHVEKGKLSVKVYRGQSQCNSLGGSISSIVTAKHLATSDLVLTSYEVLRNDIYHDANNFGPSTPELEEGRRSLRGTKRYHVIPTPLTRLCWWRVCLDEAQMVESGTAAAASMALKLNTVHKWCVTGTPINRGLEDIQGLLRFLRVQPWDDGTWWRKAIQESYGRGGEGDECLHSLLRQIMWRNTKCAVADQLGLPGQAEVLTKLRFHAIERHWYRKQHEAVKSAARAIAGFRNFDSSADEGVRNDRPLTEREAARVFSKLLLLRQACCHPQVGRGGIRSGVGGSNQPMTMNEILSTLIERARLEGEEAQRLVVSSLNGIAGVQQLEGRLGDAVATYREALAGGEENLRYGVRMDPLQKLHTLHNLHGVLEKHKSGIVLHPSDKSIVPTLRDGQLRDQIEAIRSKFLEEADSRLALHTMQYNDFKRTVASLMQNCGGVRGEGWWAETLSTVGQSFVDRVQENLSRNIADNKKVATSLSHRFTNARGLQAVLLGAIEDIESSRKQMFQALGKLATVMRNMSEEHIFQAGNCGKCRPQGYKNVVCVHCETDALFMAYEARIFTFRAQALNAGSAVNTDDAIAQYVNRDLRLGQGGLNEGDGILEATSVGGRNLANNASGRTAHVVQMPSETERILRLLLSQVEGGDSARLTIARTHLEAFEGMRKEFLLARTMTRAQRDALARRDELDMATTTMRLAASDEEVAEHEKLYKLRKHELPGLSVKLTGDKMVYADELRREMGQLRFLRNLSSKHDPDSKMGRQDTSLPEREEESKCPVCLQALEREFFMLPCGHSICTECGTNLQERARCVVAATSNTQPIARTKRIACPTCRTPVPCTDIAHVNDGNDCAVRTEQGASIGTVVQGTLPWAGGLDALHTEAEIKLFGSYSSKIEAVVRRIKWLVQREEEGPEVSKIILFSQWQDALEITAHALAANKVSHVYAANRRQLGRALARFRDSSPSDTINVLLMPLSLGANGLNITEAQHVILMEPLLDPGVEVQAMGRVHRIGQLRRTVVHRFVIDDTVEENVSNVCRRRVEMLGARIQRRQDRNWLSLSEIHTLLRGD